MSSIARILAVRKVREDSIRAHMRALSEQIGGLGTRIAATYRERRRHRDAWQLALGRGGLFDHAMLRQHADDLSQFHALDLAYAEKIEGLEQQVQALNAQLETAQADLRVNIVGQEKLKSLLEQGVGEPD